MVGSRMNEYSKGIFTIGHSDHSTEFFLELLNKHGITALADVRSAPYSRFNPQFNRETIASTLKASSIRYVYLGKELGGRSSDPTCYDHGRIRYDRLAQSSRVQEGIKRVITGAMEYRIALMCAEKEPLHCHRTLLIGHELDTRGIDVTHILSDGRLESHTSAMNRLVSELGLGSDDDLFQQHKSRGVLIEEAIMYQSQRVGHAVEPTADATVQEQR